MKLLADEGVDRQIVERLRRDGYDVFYIAETEPSITDDRVLQRALQNGAVLITADKDFGELVFRQQQFHVGIVLLRLAGISPDLKAEMVAQALQAHSGEMPEAFTVLLPGALRIRRKQ